MIRATLIAAALLFASPARADAISDLYQASYDLEASFDYAGSLDKVERLVRAGEDDYVVHLRRGWLLYLNGRYADAVLAYTEATARQPGSAEAYSGLALPLMALRRWSEAESACRKVLQLAPGNYLGMSRLAYVLYSSGRYGDAEAQYAAIVRLFPSDVEMRTGLGWALLKQGKSSDARRAFGEVLRTAPNHVSAGEGLAASQ